MSISTLLQIPYWDVWPRSIRLSPYPSGPQVQLTIQGDFPESPEFESSDADIVWVDGSGYLYPGYKPGRALITIFDSWRRESARFVQVEVIEDSGFAYSL